MLITIEHAARELGISESTVREMIKEHRLISTKPGYVTYVMLPDSPSTPEKKNAN